MDLLRDSSNTVYMCTYCDQEDLQIIDVKTIESVVAMVPLTPSDGDLSAQHFLVEKPGLGITTLQY